MVGIITRPEKILKATNQHVRVSDGTVLLQMENGPSPTLAQKMEWTETNSTIDTDNDP